jgi:hypothetical protein
MAAKLTRRTHKIAIQLHIVAERNLPLAFSLQEASPGTFGYTLLTLHIWMSLRPVIYIWKILSTMNI